MFKIFRLPLFSLFVVSLISWLGCGSGGSGHPTAVSPSTTAGSPSATPSSGGSPTASLMANPTAVQAGQPTTLSWQTQDATTVTLNGVAVQPSGSQTVTPSATATFELVAFGMSGTQPATSTITVTVNPAATLQSSVNHIILEMQENRSFDHYFGHLNDYRTAKSLPADVDDLSKAGDPSLPSWDGSGRISPYHLLTACIGDLSSSWQEAHADINLDSPNEGHWGTPPPMNGFAAMAGGFAAHDPARGGFDVAGKRAMGFYTADDLPFYYWAATTFATSDRWFSPALTRTQPNRMYFLAATSNGYAFPGGTGDVNHPPLNMGGVKSIFQLLEENHITWKVYVTDNLQTDKNGNTINPGDTYMTYFGFTFQHLDHFVDASTFSTDAANGTLPQVALIESGYTVTGSDEHPLNPVDKGARYDESLVRALMDSPSWKDSVFLITYDEGGGMYDHVPPVQMPSPDGKKPILAPGDPTGDFDTTGFRVPLIVISPFAKSGYVSHTNADFTALLKFIETRFGLPPLTKRDAAQPDMTEFFDWTAPNLNSTTPPIQPGLPCYFDHLP